MTAWYNENDPFAAAWLRNLIEAKLIAPGVVDERSISDVRPVELRGFKQCHFFAGIGGWSLALRQAAVPDDFEVWTGSCPCQPFSAAGKRGGFADERHLWPHWHWLIEQRRPAIVLGEQVASAAQWLRLVRGDLETLGYAVGAIPVEAASAGADHLRDRFWFVGHDTRVGRREGRTESEFWSEWHAIAGASGKGNLADDNDARLQRRALSGERLVEWSAGTNGVANPDFSKRWVGDEQPSRQFPQQQRDSETRTSGDLGNTGRTGTGRHGSRSTRSQASGGGEGVVDGDLCQSAIVADTAADLEWVIGADGKARRVKSGLRLLVDGFPNRVGLLRGFGNAIDPRPAAEFIKAALACRP